MDRLRNPDPIRGPAETHLLATQTSTAHPQTSGRIVATATSVWEVHGHEIPRAETDPSSVALCTEPATRPAARHHGCHVLGIRSPGSTRTDVRAITRTDEPPPV